MSSPTTHTLARTHDDHTWPTIKKSAAMESVERLHAMADGGHPVDIRDIILDRLRMYPDNKTAAVHIGISPSLLSHWIVKLGIYETARAIRASRYR